MDAPARFSVPARWTLAAALAAGAALIALTVVVGGGPVDYVSAPSITEGARGIPEPSAIYATPTGATGASTSEPDSLPHWLVLLIQLAVAAIGLLLLALIGYLLRHMVLRLLDYWNRPGETAFEAGVVNPLPEVREPPDELVGASAQRRRERLASGEPRNAVVACWIDLEAGVAATGLPRRAWETASEYAARVLSRWDVDATALGELAGLYREARFSAHPITESQRTRALDALDRIDRDLARAGAP